MEELKDLLHSKEIKPTYQRLAILKYLVDHKTHPTVERIYKQLKNLIPTMSRTTIYNTLGMFIKAGLVHPVLISSTEVRYDADMSQHHHFLCEKCGNIFDIDMICPQSRAGEIQGHKINEVHGYFKGICHECRTGGE